MQNKSFNLVRRCIKQTQSKSRQFSMIDSARNRLTIEQKLMNEVLKNL